MKKLLAVIVIVALVFAVRVFAQSIPTSTLSTDCTTAYVSATNTDSGQWTSGEINQQIAVATQDEINLRQKLVQDDVTLGLYVPLQMAITQCIAQQNAQTNSVTNSVNSTGD